MKIFKLFVCIALILSISLINSFAAISVSDGSAFVTKAEFAADLNNLSNRMSTLENSLDAKIDSLVSSYLSRNGIWNGEKQEFPNALKTKSIIPKDDEINWVKTYNKTGKTLLVYYSHTDTLAAIVQVVSKVSKAGLCFVDFVAWNYSTMAAAGSTTRGLISTTNATGYNAGYQYNEAATYGWNGNNTYAFYVGKSSDTTSNITPSYGNCFGHIVQGVSLSGSYNRDAANMENLYVVAQKAQNQVSFFVNKDDKIFLTVYLYGGGGRNDTTAWVAFQWNNRLLNGIPNSPSFNISNIAIY